MLDIEFALQGLVLAHAAAHPGLLAQTANASLIEACHRYALLDQGQADILARVHAELLKRALACTLDLRPRIAPREPALEAMCAEVREVTTALGFDFA